MEESNEKDVENQLGALRNHLLALGRTEGQLQALKEKSMDLAPAKPETSVVEILQVYKVLRIFVLFGNYFQLFTSVLCREIVTVCSEIDG